jgi:type I restriction enzyme, R subunit
MAPRRRDHIAANAVIAPQDLMEAPDFAALGRLDRAYALFGAQLQPLLEELPQVLVA